MIKIRIKGKNLIAKIYADNERIFKAKVKAQKETLKQMPITELHALMCAMTELAKEFSIFRRKK